MTEPCMSAVRKWMPPQTRASRTSLIIWEIREKLRVVWELLLNALKATLSVPKNAWRVLPIAPTSQLWPDGWSGKAGVASSGVHIGSATVAGLPSVSARRIAVIGRQKFQKYLSFQQLINASAPA